MRSIACLAALLMLGSGFVVSEGVLSSGSAGEKPKAADLQWRTLFADDDLSGWEGLIQQHWKLIRGELVGTNLPRGLPYRTFLCSKKRYKDFEIRFQVRLRGPANANSGLNFRSEILDRSKFTVTGPQADMGAQYWGPLSSEFIRGKPSTAIKSAPRAVLAGVKQQDFNDYYVRCVGKHVTIKLNGETTVDDNFPWIQNEGIIAWQVHANPTEVTFRQIEIRDFSATKGSLPNIIADPKDKSGQKKK